MIAVDDLAAGEKFTSSSRTVFDADIVNFAGLSGDLNRLHVGDVFAASTIHQRRIAQGMLIASSDLRVSGTTRRCSAGWRRNAASLPRCSPGNTIMAADEVEARRSKSHPDTGVVTLAVTVTKQTGEIQTGRDTLLIERNA